MKIKKKEVMYLVALLGVLAAVAVYVWVYMPYNEKTAALESENAVQITHLAELQVWSGQVNHFNEETVRMIRDVNETFNRFPVASKAEDSIMYAVELEAQSAGTYISAIGLDEPEVVYQSAPSSVKLNDLEEGGERSYQLCCQQVTYTHEVTYNGLKQFINAIVNDSERKSVESLNVAYDNTTGILVGTTMVNVYTLEGTDRQYRKTQIPHMPIGTNNIFGTIDRSPVSNEQPAE